MGVARGLTAVFRALPSCASRSSRSGGGGPRVSCTRGHGAFCVLRALRSGVARGLAAVDN